MNIYIIQFINYTLSFLMWMILGRIMTRLIFGDRENVVVGLFRKVTEPVYAVTRKILPFASDRWIPALSIVLIVVLRLALIITTMPAAGR